MHGLRRSASRDEYHNHARVPSPGEVNRHQLQNQLSQPPVHQECFRLLCQEAFSSKDAFYEQVPKSDPGWPD